MRIHSPNARSTLGWLFPLHAVVWTLAAWLSRGNLDANGDMIENYALGMAWQAGYASHPPLCALVTAAWFQVFPSSDMAYFALSTFNAIIGLFGIVALAQRFVPRQLAILAGLAMAVSPLYSSLAIKFNANAILLSVWPWTAYFFVRFMQTGKWHAAIALGVLSGAAMLGKYFSITLLLALCIATLARPAWRARLLDWRVLLIIISFCAVTTPHIYWLVQHQFQTFDYATTRINNSPPLLVLRQFGIYTLAQIGYLLPSFIFIVLLVQQKRLQTAGFMARSMIQPARSPELWWLTLSPLIAVGVIAMVTKTDLASPWGMAQWFAIIPLWLTVFDRLKIKVVFTRIMPLMAGYWLIVLLISFATGEVEANHNTEGAARPLQELSSISQQLWKQHTGQDNIPIVTGSTHEARAITFYNNGHTRFWDLFVPQATPWLTKADLLREGGLLVCREDDETCIVQAQALSGGRPIIISAHKVKRARALPSRRYWLFIMSPQP